MGKRKIKKNIYFLVTTIFAFVFLLFNCHFSKNKIYLLPTLHNLHKINKNYSYDSLIQVIKNLNPDVIAVEIRPEDINQDSTYLRKNYPYEMRMMKYWFPNAKIVGFDWLGSDIEGKPIPKDYWQNISYPKKLERELNSDSVYSKKTAKCAKFMSQRLDILKKLSLQGILKSNDALLTKKFYKCLSEQLTGSKYEKLLDFYDKRNEKILTNIENIIKKNRAKTIVVLMGDDHYVYLKDRIAHEKLFK